MSERRPSEGRKIKAVRTSKLDIELTEPFSIASGAQPKARNVLVELELEDGTIGIGEAAPFPAVSGETQESALSAIARFTDSLIGVDVGRTRLLAGLMERAEPKDPAACAGVEQAIFDAFAKSLGVPLWTLFGGAGADLETDMTIIIGDVEHARKSAKAIIARGIRSLKIKVGGSGMARDVERVRAAAAAAPDARILLDANGGFTATEALGLLSILETHGVHVSLFEQPVPVDDLDGMAAITRSTEIAICADESARSPEDVLRLIEARAVNSVNIKLMKTGVVKAMDMVTIARAAGLQLMIGGMVESILAMTFSAHFAIGIGGFSFGDLDTPFFMKDSPFEGGFEVQGGRIVLPKEAIGVGVRRKS